MKYKKIQPAATAKSNRFDHVLKYFPQPVSFILNAMSTAIRMFIKNSRTIKNGFFHALESMIVQTTKIVQTRARARYASLHLFG